ncbi:hypothetical protein HS088_TW07G00910 [Tripterygium wilfordii]|uniref:Uncharacterized protein n=1 Tax=Tripterygium wilfordii TaxID=458696 RepID=A0A7J7DGZ5_TRIWF|nr:hypothetical protein HS088_TW07G00910 [Tripterygium wilfordii]
MESSQIVGSGEDGSVSESGWTKYIDLPPMKKNYSEDGNDSDDSMASDASSGPSHLELPCEERFDSSPTKHTARKKSSGGKLHKQVKTIRDGRKNRTEKEEPVRKAKSAASQVQNGPKLLWLEVHLVFGHCDHSLAVSAAVYAAIVATTDGASDVAGSSDVASHYASILSHPKCSSRNLPE